MEDLLSGAAIYEVDPQSHQIVQNVNVILNSPGAQVAQAEGHSAAVAGNDSQGAAGGGTDTKGAESAAGSGKWTVVLLVAIAGFGALYLTDTIKLWEAGIGTGFIAAVAAALGVPKK